MSIENTLSLHANVQLLVATPPSRLLDDTLVGLLSDAVRHPHTASNVRILSPTGPRPDPTGVAAPTFLSPTGVGRLLDAVGEIDADLVYPYLFEVLTCLRDPESVAVLAARASNEWLRWAVHLNPLSLNMKSLPPVPVEKAALERSDVGFIRPMLSAVLPVADQLRREAPLNVKILLQSSLAREFEEFAARNGMRIGGTYPSTDVGFGRAEVDDSWIGHLSRVGMPGYAVTGPMDPVAHNARWMMNPAGAIDPLWNEQSELGCRVDAALETYRNGLPGGRPVFALQRDGHLLEGLLRHTRGYTWLQFLGDRSVVRPQAPRIVGRDLFDVTGDDPGLWSVALELLRGWEGTMPEWLDLVRSLD